MHVEFPSLGKILRQSDLRRRVIIRHWIFSDGENEDISAIKQIAQRYGGKIVGTMSGAGTGYNMAIIIDVPEEEAHDFDNELDQAGYEVRYYSRRMVRF